MCEESISLEQVDSSETESSITSGQLVAPKCANETPLGNTVNKQDQIACIEDGTQINTNKDPPVVGEPEAPDGSYGWVVVIAAFLLNLLIGGAVNTFGVLYVALLESHKQGSGPTAWVGSMANAMGLLLGPLSSALSSRFSCRSMVVVGGVLIAAGWCITGYMPRIEYMFITYGLLAGIGKSLAYTPSIVMVGKWFNRRRSLANGITLSGVGVGTFAFAPLLEALLKKYSFSGTMLIMGGVMLNVSVCGLFFLPVPSKITTRKKQTVLINGNCEEMSTKKCDANSNNHFQHEQAMNTNGNMKDSNSISSSKSVPAKEASYVPASKFVLKDYIDYTLLKNLSFISVGISVLLAPLGQSPAFMMLPSLAAQNNIPAQKSAFLLSITGIADIIGRLTFGAICDITYLRNNRKYVYVASIFISGVASGVCGFAHTYWHFATYAVVFGLFGGSYHALTPVILVDLLGADKLSSSFGIALLFQGIGYLVGPPLAGLISDAMGGYQSAFFFAGIASVLSSIIMNVPSIKPCWDRCIKQQHLKVTEQQRENVIVDAQEITNTNIDGNPVCISYVSNSETLKGCRSVTSTNGHDTLGYV